MPDRNRYVLPLEVELDEPVEGARALAAAEELVAHVKTLLRNGATPWQFGTAKIESVYPAMVLREEARS